MSDEDQIQKKKLKPADRADAKAESVKILGLGSRNRKNAIPLELTDLEKSFALTFRLADIEFYQETIEIIVDYLSNQLTDVSDIDREKYIDIINDQLERQPSLYDIDPKSVPEVIAKYLEEIPEHIRQSSALYFAAQQSEDFNEEFSAIFDRSPPGDAQSDLVNTDSLFEKSLVEEFGWSASKARDLAPAAREAILKLEQLAEGIPLDAGDPEGSASIGEIAVDPRFAHIEKYENRLPGEDAISFYQRVWADAPKPYYRDDIEQHDPDLIPAMSQRCRNLNRSLAPGQERYRLETMLPGDRPLAGKTAERRQKGRERQAKYRARQAQKLEP